DIDVASGAIRTLERKPAVGMRLGVASGTVTAAANAAIMTALHTGDLAVVAVLNNLYPVSTIVLAWLVLRERLSPLQLTGVALAVVASVLLGLA
ncbi:MAG TPA: EamA family transporter, partial [Microbacterium sp.]|nr:EamA family transporter [Microbacterium sp.]